MNNRSWIFLKNLLFCESVFFPFQVEVKPKGHWVILVRTVVEQLPVLLVFTVSPVFTVFTEVTVLKVVTVVVEVRSTWSRARMWWSNPCHQSSEHLRSRNLHKVNMMNGVTFKITWWITKLWIWWIGLLSRLIVKSFFRKIICFPSYSQSFIWITVLLLQPGDAHMLTRVGFGSNYCKTKEPWLR